MRSNDGYPVRTAKSRTKGTVDSNVVTETTAETEGVVQPALALLVEELSNREGRSLGAEVDGGVTSRS